MTIVPLVATKWLNSVSAVLCAFMFVHLAPWYVVKYFFLKKSLKIGSSHELVGLGRVALKKKGRATGWPIFYSGYQIWVLAGSKWVSSS